MMIEHFQNLIIGSGVAGKILAWTLGKEGQKTVVVERSMIGGPCVNVACLPSKNVIYSANAISLVGPTKVLGVVSGAVRADVQALLQHPRPEKLLSKEWRERSAQGCRLAATSKGVTKNSS
jgi:pyruvate/2-oxoglutarate dehydrogenase complex dihydrolipoamide dehydrogenase (E3) component